MSDLTLDVIVARLTAAGSNADTEADRVGEEMIAASLKMWPKAPPDAHRAYADAKVRFALQIVRRAR